ncbi:MAG: molybdopterin-dependent oxidoreductase, partial [Deltaproteobacteria bacterium]|nr:molybdopterin-dependent oxidoreductase [Deltaproteobacteria bacterium]
MVILGAGLNHWYHMDMNYRGIMNLLIMCGRAGAAPLQKLPSGQTCHGVLPITAAG